jgi:hypothetical protein
MDCLFLTIIAQSIEALGVKSHAKADLDKSGLESGNKINLILMA